MSDTAPESNGASTGTCCGCDGEPATAEEPTETSDGDDGATLGALFGTLAGALSLVAIPKCPMCLTAYAGVLSAVGLGFLANAAILEPLIGGMLLVQIGFVAWSTRSHRSPWPVVATATGALAVGLARWVLISDPLLYLGAVAIVGAAAANFWLMQPRISRLRRAGG